MTCKRCGKIIDKADRYCSYCGKHNNMCDTTIPVSGLPTPVKTATISATVVQDRAFFNNEDLRQRICAEIAHELAQQLISDTRPLNISVRESIYGYEYTAKITVVCEDDVEKSTSFRSEHDTHRVIEEYDDPNMIRWAYK